METPISAAKMMRVILIIAINYLAV